MTCNACCTDSVTQGSTRCHWLEPSEVCGVTGDVCLVEQLCCFNFWTVKHQLKLPSNTCYISCPSKPTPLFLYSCPKFYKIHMPLLVYSINLKRFLSSVFFFSFILGTTHNYGKHWVVFIQIILEKLRHGSNFLSFWHISPCTDFNKRCFNTTLCYQNMGDNYPIDWYVQITGHNFSTAYDDVTPATVTNCKKND